MRPPSCLVSYVRVGYVRKVGIHYAHLNVGFGLYALYYDEAAPTASAL